MRAAVAGSHAWRMDSALAQEIGLQPLRRGDSQTVARVFAGLSDRSKRSRFLGPKPTLRPVELAQLADVERDAHRAIVATAPETGEPIGVARYVREDDGGTAEFAIAVVDPWQGRGVGKLLTRELVRVAVANGVRRFRAILAPGNGPALALVRGAGAVERTAWNGSDVELTIVLD